MAEKKRTAPLARDAMAYVLAGGRGSRLLELTDRRAKPAVPFGGKSRIIDFALSNALNSGIRRIGVATQYKAHSLIRHLTRGWNFFRPERNESFDILPASQRVSEDQWYAGTADAVYQNLDIIEAHDPKYIVILAGEPSRRIVVETASREVVSDEPYEADSLVMRIHSGEIFGEPGILLGLFWGGALMVLSVTGVIVYFSMMAKRAKARGKLQVFW